MGRGPAVNSIRERLAREPYASIWEVASNMLVRSFAPLRSRVIPVARTSGPSVDWFPPKMVMDHLEQKGRSQSESQVRKALATLVHDGLLSKGRGAAHRGQFRLADGFLAALTWSDARADLSAVPFAGSKTVLAETQARRTADGVTTSLASWAHVLPRCGQEPTAWNDILADAELDRLLLAARRQIEQYLRDEHGTAEEPIPRVDVVLRFDPPTFDWMVGLDPADGRALGNWWTPQDRKDDAGEH